MPRWAWIPVGVVVLLLLWYGVIGGIQARIHPDPALRPTPAQLPSGGSVAVGFAARLLDVEINDRRFTPNDPFFFPTGFAQRAPAYQAAVTGTVGAFVDALATAPDAEALADASRLLRVPADQWTLQFGWPPIRSSAERAYRRAVEALETHNRQLAADYSPETSSGGDRISPHGRAALAALADSLEAQVMRGDLAISGSGTRSVATEFAAARGTAYAAAMLMRGLRDDHATAIRLSGRAARWGEALDQLDATAASSPLITGESHLVRAGYHLLMASTAIRHILE